MNHDANGAAELIGAVLEVCAKRGIKLASVRIDPQLALELGLKAGDRLPNGTMPILVTEEGPGRSVVFERPGT
jgi:hypothetical protein